MVKNTGPGRSERSTYMLHKGIKQFGIPWTLLFVALQTWHGQAPTMSLSTWRDVLAILWFVTSLILAGVIAGALFGYLWWMLERWLLGAPD